MAPTEAITWKLHATEWTDIGQLKSISARYRFINRKG